MGVVGIRRGLAGATGVITDPPGALAGAAPDSPCVGILIGGSFGIGRFTLSAFSEELG